MIDCLKRERLPVTNLIDRLSQTWARLPVAERGGSYLVNNIYYYIYEVTNLIDRLSQTRTTA
ncbi:hypothetical protein PCHCB_000524500, partial [Plasmodium chabaudi chabaudi]